MTSLIQAAQITVPVPKAPPGTEEVVNKGREALAPLAGQPLVYVGLFVLALLAIYFSARTGRVAKLVSLGVLALLVVGWDSDRGVLTAAAGSKAAADQWLLTGLAIGAAWALLKGPKGRVATANGGRRSLMGRFGRGR